DIDMNSRRNLELTETMRDKTKKGSLYWVLDKTRTSMGSRMLKSWILCPLVSVGPITARLSGVEELVNNLSLREEIRDAMNGILDIERLMSRASMGVCNARDLVALRSSFAALPRLYKALCSCRSPIMNRQAAVFDTLEDLWDLLERAIEDEPPIVLREGKLIKKGFNEEIDRLRAASDGGKGSIGAIEARERDRTGIKNLKVKYNKVFGFYIEVSNSQLSKVPEDYVRKQTTVNGERFITPELKEVESTVLGATERLTAMEYEQFVDIRVRVCGEIERIERTARAIATADVLCSLAEAAVKNRYVRPEINISDEIYIKDGRHPVVEQVLKKSVFVPNDTELDCGPNRAAIITGPNMAGKSTYMRQVALIALMAQIGSFVPASQCRIGVVDKIFTRIGASDDLASGQSTFTLEMSEVSYILKNATKNSLCILDEVGRGTSTFDGLSIAWAVIEHIVNKIGMKTLFATHYHELTALEERLKGVKNYNTVCKKRGDDITFLRKIVRGGTDESYGIEVAKLSGVPNPVIKRAKEVLAEIQSGEIKRDVPVPQEQSQLSFAPAEDSPAVEALKEIDITTLTPIEALNKLYELQKMI
ncbi:MAG: DNA mismatch repair protein MutS, partial [Oscillospiraceae bacterium]|nr:DNA mismatch repair protein MutS [Oscillospiraceae bacterium]